jgi:hypothetical protein
MLHPEQDAAFGTLAREPRLIGRLGVADQLFEVACDGS